MSTWVLLQSPPDKCYNRIIKACIDQHFEMLDNGYVEIASGNWYDMCELEQSMHVDLEESHPILLFCRKNSSYCYHNEESLSEMLTIDPNYLTNKVFL